MYFITRLVRNLDGIAREVKARNLGAEVGPQVEAQEPTLGELEEKPATAKWLV